MFDVATENSQYTIPLHDGVPTKNVWWGEVVASKPENQSTSPLAGSLMRINGGEPSKTPQYPWDETIVVIKGEITVEDETGQKAKLLPGEACIVHRGSVITFSAERFALVFKTSACAPMMINQK